MHELYDLNGSALVAKALKGIRVKVQIWPKTTYVLGVGRSKEVTSY